VTFVPYGAPERRSDVARRRVIDQAVGHGSIHDPGGHSGTGAPPAADSD
jgi:hypothetical protein